MAINADLVSVRKPVDDAFERLFIKQETGHKNMIHLIHLRWLAVVGQILTICVVTLVLGIPLPLFPMWVVLVGLAAFNLGSHLRWHEERVASNTALFLALLVDVGTLTAQLFFSGGTGNPFVFLFLLQVILSAILLRALSAWTVVMITTLCLAGLSVFNQPLILPEDSPYELPNLYETGLLICFVLNAALLTFLINRIGSNLRAGEQVLSDLTQRKTEEEHIVRMGLLASGAAHELGTPMATMSVILGDWRHLSEVQSNADLMEDLDELELQLQRCKAIVSGILMSAGEARGESAVRTTLRTFLAETVSQWQAGRPHAQLVYQDHLEQDHPAATDSAVKQMIFNVLDNAAEASPTGLRLDVRLNATHLELVVSDYGCGFAPEVLDQLGKPYNSTKGKPGGGLGLFLVTNVARSLGGSVKARNREEGGAVVQISLPLRALVLEQELRGG